MRFRLLGFGCRELGASHNCGLRGPDVGLVECALYTWALKVLLATLNPTKP